MAAVVECRRRFSKSRIPMRQFFSVTRSYKKEGHFFQVIRNTYHDSPLRWKKAFWSLYNVPKRLVLEGCLVEKMNPHSEYSEPYGMIALIIMCNLWQVFKPDHYALHVQFFQSMFSHRWILHHILFSGEAQIYCDGVNNSPRSHLWSANNPYGTADSITRHRFSVIIWWGLIRDLLVWTFV
jgi:hypothetical protein